jgi:hypothetical protein
MDHQSQPHGDNRKKSTGHKLHRDWRLWVAVVLMLLGMVIYLLTLDERVVPAGSVPGPGTPAGSNASAQP